MRRAVAPSPSVTLTSSISTSRLVWRSVAEKSMPALEVCVRELTSFSWPISSCALSMRALDLVVRALGPRRSHSVSILTRFLSASWSLDCASMYCSLPSRNWL